MSGVTVASACVDIFNQIKMKKDLRYVTFKIEDGKEIVVDCSGPPDENWDDFVAKLPEEEPRYALVDVPFENKQGVQTSKLTFVAWSPDDKTTVKQRMVYASSKKAIKDKFVGVMKEVQANDMSDLAWDDILKKMQD
mmetsp:Transcript_122507/g.352030  ORF Transcript_122507/g.352030 Transcript_122507/m.352030 type:complete len:137 (+) Transcript_122507:90-500(+)